MATVEGGLQRFGEEIKSVGWNAIRDGWAAVCWQLWTRLHAGLERTGGLVDDLAVEPRYTADRTTADVAIVG
ncbi:MAG: hypothetical protein JNL62_25685 [Bryobacterales bacterium]|nr:hypothetical protein [Bryobacterales bacterium]